MRLSSLRKGLPGRSELSMDERVEALGAV